MASHVVKLLCVAHVLGECLGSGGSRFLETATGVGGEGGRSLIVCRNALCVWFAKMGLVKCCVVFKKGSWLVLTCRLSLVRRRGATGGCAQVRL